jgi:hypothetical protein
MLQPGRRGADCMDVGSEYLSRDHAPWAETSEDFAQSLALAGQWDAFDDHARLERALGIPLNEIEYVTFLHLGLEALSRAPDPSAEHSQEVLNAWRKLRAAVNALGR